MAETALIDGYTFLATGDDGALPASGGLFHRDTRFLSEFDVELDGATLRPLGTDLRTPARRTIHYANGFSGVNEISESESDKHTPTVLTRDQSVHCSGDLTEEIAVTNHSTESVDETLRITYGADFADLFEVRGVNADIERDVDRSVTDEGVSFEYAYLDDTGSMIRYATTVSFDPEPDSMTDERATFETTLGPQERAAVTVHVETSTTSTDDSHSRDATDVSVPVISVENAAYAETFEQAAADVEALTAASPHGPVILAGAPWFATVFGRDSLLTAYQVLPVAPELAVGTLRYLAAHQSDVVDRPRRAEPGKIFHEIRHGELARTGEIRYDPFYGSIDATALWVIVLEEVYQWTGDEAVVRGLESALDGALEWLVAAMDGQNDDPFVYYEENPVDNITHTAWKDSDMSVQFADGREATPPIASAEVQGYVYDALERGADLVHAVFGDDDMAERLTDRATDLYERFNEEFWLPERKYYASAKTGDGEFADTLTSNVGQCLWSGIVDPDRAAHVAENLFSDEMYSGWGVRSMGATGGGYSPVSYHVGSVWPHDNSFIALGLARYSFHDYCERLAGDLLDATTHWDDRRIPEVFCGFDDDSAPVSYPASCEPQAWSAGSPYALVRAVFDVSPRPHDTHRACEDPLGLCSEALEPFQNGDA